MSRLAKILGWNRKTEPMGNGSLFYFTNYGIQNDISEFKNENAYIISKSIAEAYNPIDIISSRVASVEYVLANKSDGKIIVEPLRLQKLRENVNPHQDFESFIYELVFTMLSQGGVDVYRNASGSKTDISRINSLWVLNQANSYPKYNRNIRAGILGIAGINELLARYEFALPHGERIKLEPEDIVSYADNGFDYRNFSYISPLNGAKRNVNNLLMVYEARFNQYKNNGAAGILSRKASDNSEFASLKNDERQQMIDDMNSVDGVTNGKNFIGISGVPVEFIRTLGTISELMPFEETLENQLKIASIYDVDKELLPKVASTTFTNKKDAERFLWQNKIKPYAQTVAKLLNKYMLIPENQTFIPIFDNVEVLQADRKESLEADILETELIARLDALNIDTTHLKNKWKN